MDVLKGFFPPGYKMCCIFFGALDSEIAGPPRKSDLITDVFFCNLSAKTAKS